MQPQVGQVEFLPRWAGKAASSTTFQFLRSLPRHWLAKDWQSNHRAPCTGLLESSFATVPKGLATVRVYPASSMGEKRGPASSVMPNMVCRC